jgi:hypothetical protein
MKAAIISVSANQLGVKKTGVIVGGGSLAENSVSQRKQWRDVASHHRRQRNGAA